MRQRITIVDAFAERAFTGNPAAVCVLSEPMPDRWMQDVAAEMNLSETCFVLREGEFFSLRWFTPTVEVDLCGHATLAAAHVLWEEDFIATDSSAQFNTRSGRLVVVQRDERIEMDFPAMVSRAIDPPAGLQEALGTEATHVERNDRDLLVEVADESTLRQLQPDLAWVAALPTLGLIVTCRAQEPPYDFVSRYFAPRAGIDEDPVCGSAHCCLGPYWSKRLEKTKLCGYQASARGGVVHVAVKEPRVKLAGNAVTVLQGELTAEAHPKRTSTTIL